MELTAHEQEAHEKALSFWPTVKALQRGERILVAGSNLPDSNTLIVKRHASGSWVMWLQRPNDLPPLHTRWADYKDQLIEDLEYYYRSNFLPINEKNRW